MRIFWLWKYNQMGTMSEREMLKHGSAAGQGFVSLLVTSPNSGSFIRQPVPTRVQGPQAFQLPAVLLISQPLPVTNTAK